MSGQRFSVQSYVGAKLTEFLSKPRDAESHLAVTDPLKLAATLKPGDVLLVEGNSRFSTAIKYLSQSNWSHAALYVGDVFPADESTIEKQLLVEADVAEGVRAVPLSFFSDLPTRICRPVGLNAAEIQKVVDHVCARIGHQYDKRNIFDLARYLIQKPPVPTQWRRRLLALGSGDPTRAICSSLIAEAFQILPYPILPLISYREKKTFFRRDQVQEIWHIRHHSLFAPRDFDVSPYFNIVKPTIDKGFDPHKVVWGEDHESIQDMVPTDEVIQQGAD